MSKVIFDKKIVLVLGGAGFIGSNLCDELLKTSKVVCIDNFSSSNENNIDHLLSEPDFEFVNHNLEEPIDLDTLPGLQKFKIKFQGVQEIYNLACPMSIKNFPKNKIKILNSNSVVIKNALELAMKYDAKFLHVSSSVVYGLRRDDSRRLKEDDIMDVDFLSGRGAYDEGKRFAETMVINYQRELKVDAKVVRLFRTYGPRMPLGDDQMIPDFIDAALDGRDLEIFGDESFSSSFCYISDVIDAFFKIMASEENGPINIGSDVNVNITDIANKIIDYTASNSGIKYESKKEFINPLCLPDISRARDKLGWLPVVPLEKGIRDTVHHIRANKGVVGVKNVMEGFVDLSEE